MRLREDQVITPGGKKGIYGVVETSPAIGIVPLDEHLNTYLVGQYRYPLKTYTWEIPEGGAEPGETPLAAAKRELQEETGLCATKWTKLGTLYTSNSITNEIGYVFLAENLKDGEAQPEHTEELIIKRVPFIRAYKQVLNFKIKDALAVIGKPAVPFLIEISKDAPQTARINAMRALAEIVDFNAIPALMAALDDDSVMMQHWAEEGLERLGLNMIYLKPE